MGHKMLCGQYVRVIFSLKGFSEIGDKKRATQQKHLFHCNIPRTRVLNNNCWPHYEFSAK